MQPSKRDSKASLELKIDDSQFEFHEEKPFQANEHGESGHFSLKKWCLEFSNFGELFYVGEVYYAFIYKEEFGGLTPL